MSTPVMLSVAKPQVDIQTGHPAVQQTTAVLSQNQNLANTNTTSSQSIHNPNSFILGSNITVSNQEEQTNKLALLLQNKASQQSGSGKPAVLKVGNQSINISNPKVAKALAANILQQHMRQQTNNNVQQTQQQVVNVTKSQNHAFINLSNMPTQPQVSSGVQPQMKAQYVISTMAQTVQQLPPTSIQTQSNSKVISPEVSTASNPTQYVQLAVSKNNNQVPINRIQIASVNIPISVSTTKASDSSNLGYSSNTSHSVPSIFSSNPITISSTSAHNHYTTVTQNMNPMESVEPQAKPINKDQLTKAWNQQNSQQKINSLTVTTNSTQPASTTMPITLSTQSKLSDSFQKPTMAYVTFQVEPNLTLQQVEQVQNIISQKTSLSKIPALSKEQKQLLAAFRAQLRTMEAPVQQYYLRNPQLFLQKVYQHLQTGKPFVMHMKVDKSKLTTLQTVSSSPTVVSQLVKEEHPTISLTSNYPRASSPSSRVKRSATPNSQLKAPKRLATDTTTAMSPVTRPSLILEQLQKHRELVGNPDIVTPFKTMRDAVRRLLPYHTCNTAEVKHKDFVESEPLFEVISDKLTSKVNAMFSKYHHLACRETTRNECSADVVMLQRSFLQSERAAVVEIKQRITKNPSAIREFISKGQKDSAVTTYFSAEEAKKIDRMESTQDTNQSKVNTNDHSPVEVEKDVLLQEAVLSIL
uniref:GLTSCR1-like protein n=1 Tax=Phallusia mammillata TaxID=59560 RepID=A0A6F9D8B1_9ASCI|nr:GLTSCR1-like protein [Phallusia mammillata]